MIDAPTQYRKRPVYAVQLTDLRFTRTGCLCCGRAAGALLARPSAVPAQATLDYSECNGLDRYMIERGNAIKCGRCRIEEAAAAVAPLPPEPVLSEDQKELVALRARLDAIGGIEPAPPIDHTPAAALFPIGQLRISPEAARQMGRTVVAGWRQHESVHEAIGRKAIAETVLPRHCSGDFGLAGTLADPIKDGDPLDPRLDHAERAALAIRSGRGAVFSRYMLSTYNPDRQGEPVDLRIWTWIDSGGGTITLVSTDRDHIDIR